MRAYVCVGGDRIWRVAVEGGSSNLGGLSVNSGLLIRSLLLMCESSWEINNNNNNKRRWWWWWWWGSGRCSIDMLLLRGDSNLGNLGISCSLLICSILLIYILKAQMMRHKCKPGEACEWLNLRRGFFRSASLLRAHDEVDANEAESKEGSNYYYCERGRVPWRVHREEPPQLSFPSQLQCPAPFCHSKDTREKRTKLKTTTKQNV